MPFIKKIRVFIDNNPSMNTLLRLLIISCIFFIIYVTSSVWSGIFTKVWYITRPFIFGFALAYILNPLIAFFEKHKIKKSISISIVFILLVGGVFTFFTMFIPMTYNRLIDFFSTIYINIDYVKDLVSFIDNPQVLAFVKNMIDQISITIDSSYKDLLVLSLSSNVSNLVRILLDLMTLILFSGIISIYMLVDFKDIKKIIKSGFRLISEDAPIYLSEIDNELHIYINSVFVLMCIKFVEYSALYYLLGHRDFWVMGLLTAFGLIIPYFGAAVANILGVLTMLHMGLGKVVILLIAIFVLSNLDAYVISPFVHSRRSTLNPLWILFAIFMGGNLLGVMGILIAVPVLIGIKTCLNAYTKFHRIT